MSATSQRIVLLRHGGRDRHAETPARRTNLSTLVVSVIFPPRVILVLALAIVMIS